LDKSEVKYVCHSEAPAFGARNLLLSGVSPNRFLVFASLIAGMTIAMAIAVVWDYL
jgi:hypothetical protein